LRRSARAVGGQRTISFVVEFNAHRVRANKRREEHTMLNRRALIMKGVLATGMTAALSAVSRPIQAQTTTARSPASPVEYEMYSDLMSTPEMRAVFSENRTRQSWLRTWAAMAEAQAEHGLVPKEAAAKITEVSRSLTLSGAEMAADTRKVGRGIAPALRRLRTAVGKDVANYVHLGSTTQDIMDTGLALQMKDGLDFLERDTRALMQKLIETARAHRSTVMAGRTNGMQAAPITFGLKAAGWLSEVSRGYDRLRHAKSRALMVQLGGPVGTFEVMGLKGIAVRESMAKSLGLGTQPVGWYTSRDGVAELLFAIGLLTGALGHIAVETGLLVRTEIDEVREGGEAGRGASSVLPQKSNPRSTEFVEGLSRAVQSKAAGLYAILWQSNERNGGVWIAEWSLVPEHFLLASSALRHANELIGGLAVNKEKMLANLNLDGGAILSEAFAGALTPALSRTAAYDVVKSAVQRARAQNKTLAEAITEAPEIAAKVTKFDLDRLLDPSRHVGLSAELAELACVEAERILNA
jgi:3-carboxy-cis,cis-muconate cycloisomerase